MAKQTKITSKQLSDHIIQPSHLTGESITTVINTKKANVARIIENIKIAQGTNEIEITEKVYDVVYNAQFSVDGFKNGVRTTGIENPILDLTQKGRGFANYKVWLREHNTRLALNSGINTEVFAELYIKEYTDPNVGVNGSTIVTTQSSSTADLQNIQSFDSANYVDGILCVWNGDTDEDDADLGFIDSVSGSGFSRTLIFKEDCPILYSGNYKVIRYFLKFYMYDADGNEVEYEFSSNKTIDIMFTEALDLLYEEPNNLYNYTNFYKVLNGPSPSLPEFFERQIDNAQIDNTGIDDDLREYIDFKVQTNQYVAGSLEVYIDGTKIQKLQNTDTTDIVRCIETNPTEGIFRIVNFNTTALDTQEVFVRFQMKNSAPATITYNYYIPAFSIESGLESDDVLVFDYKVLFNKSIGFFGATPSEQVVVEDIDSGDYGNIDLEIANLTFSNPPTTGELNAFRDKVEELADDNRQLREKVSELILALKSYNLI